MAENFQHFVIAAPQDEISRFMAGITFQINGFGYYLQQDAGIVPRFFTPDLEWIYCTKGESVIASEGQEYAFKPGMLALLEPERAYSARCTGKEPMHYYYIHFDVQPAYLKDAYVKRIFGESSQRWFHADAIPNYSHVFAALKRPKKELDGALRVSFSYDSSREDVDALVEALSQAQKELFTSLS